MKYCVYRQSHDSNLQQVLEYFATVEDAREYAARLKSSKKYSIEIGEFM